MNNHELELHFHSNLRGDSFIWYHENWYYFQSLSEFLLVINVAFEALKLTTNTVELLDFLFSTQFFFVNMFAFDQIINN